MTKSELIKLSRFECQTNAFGDSFWDPVHSFVAGPSAVSKQGQKGHIVGTDFQTIAEQVQLPQGKKHHQHGQQGHLH